MPLIAVEPGRPASRVTEGRPVLEGAYFCACGFPTDAVRLDLADHAASIGGCGVWDGEVDGPGDEVWGEVYGEGEICDNGGVCVGCSAGEVVAMTMAMGVVVVVVVV